MSDSTNSTKTKNQTEDKNPPIGKKLVKRHETNRNATNSLIKNFNNKNSLFFLNNDDNEESSICIFKDCKLKSINNYDFCYQHINAVNKSSTLCSWIDVDGEKCNQLSISESKNSKLMLDDIDDNDESKKESKSYCFHHIAFKKIQKLCENENNKSKSKISHKLIQSSAFEKSNVKSQSEMALDSMFTSQNQNILSEQKFLLKNSKGRPNRKQIQKERKNASKKDQSVIKKSKLTIDVENNSNEDESDENSSSDEFYEENYMFKNDSDLENDLDLLDPSDPLDQTMLNLINAKKLNDLNKLNTKKLSLKHNSETNEFLLIDYGDEEEIMADEENIIDSDEAISARNSFKTESENKYIDSNIEHDYDFLLSNAGVYTKEEVIKIFKCKLSKLQLLYKKQLSIINDRLIYDRKKYLAKKSTEQNDSNLNFNQVLFQTENKTDGKDLRLTKAAKKYQSNTKKELFLKQKYDPKLFNSANSIYNVDSKSLNNSINQKCIYSVSNAPQASKNIVVAGHKCNNLTLPFSKFCKEHIIHDSNQILFGICGENSTSTDSICKTPIIASITPKCILHLANASSLLANDELAQMNRISELKFSEVLSLNKPEQPPKHLENLAKAYKQILNKIYEEEMQAVGEHHEKIISSIIEEEAAADLIENDLIADKQNENLNIFDPSSLIHIKQEILENNQQHQDEETSMLILDNLTNEHLDFDNHNDTSFLETEKNQNELEKNSKDPKSDTNLNAPIINTEEAGDSDEDDDGLSTSESSSSSSSSSSSTSSSSSSSSTSSTSSSNGSCHTSDTDSSSNDSSDSETESESNSSLHNIVKKPDVIISTLENPSESLAEDKSLKSEVETESISKNNVEENLIKETENLNSEKDKTIDAENS